MQARRGGREIEGAYGETKKSEHQVHWDAIRETREYACDTHC
jgi:hypothetical protein